MNGKGSSRKKTATQVGFERGKSMTDALARIMERVKNIKFIFLSEEILRQRISYAYIVEGTTRAYFRDSPNKPVNKRRGQL